MNVGSLFSGIGGLDLGLERAGFNIKWQCEIDPYARAVLRKHWPDAALYDDVRTVGAANLAPVDLICGGFPCQDISNAGKRVGIEGERSGLWSEYARIIEEIRPRFVLVENVAALLARGLARVLQDLAARGYDAEWDVFSCAEFGAPHVRERLFLLAYPDSARRNGGRTVFAGQSREGLESAAWDFTAARGACGGVWGLPDPSLLRVDDGLSERLDRPQQERLRTLGNAASPVIAEWIGRRILAHAEEG